MSADRFVLGAEGPVAVVPPHLAALVAANSRVWVRDLCERAGRDQRETVDDLVAWVRAVDRVAEADRRRVMSACPQPVSELGRPAAFGGDHGEDEFAEWITPTVAAEVLGITERQVRRLVEGGRLRGRRPHGRWVVHSASVQNELDRRSAA